MTQKIKFDAARYCRSNAGRMGQWQGQDVAGLIGEEVRSLKAEVDELREAAKDIAGKWQAERAEGQLFLSALLREE